MKAQETTLYLSVTNELIGEHLRTGRAVRFTITTASMLPLLAPGDVVVVQPTDATAVRVGDIVVRPVEQIWLAHRLIEQSSSTGWVTKGDNQLGADQAVQPARMEGVVIARERAGRVVDLTWSGTRLLSSWLAYCSRAHAQAGCRATRKMWRGLIVLIASLTQWISR